MLYSNSTGGFYTSEIHGAAIPVDAVEITAEAHAALLEGQSQGKSIVADKDGYPVLKSPPEPDLEMQLRESAKAARSAAVASIVITTAAGNAFDGDETSQGRMARAVMAMQATSTAATPWVLADNTVVQVSSVELLEALALAGAAQSALWVIL